MFEILEKSAAHVICLQEVTPHFLELLSEQDWVRRDYVLSDSPKCPTTVSSLRPSSEDLPLIVIITRFIR